MGRKSRLKWERRERDGWCTPVGRLGAYYRALATGVPMKGPPRIEFVDEASYITPEAMAETLRPMTIIKGPPDASV